MAWPLSHPLRVLLLLCGTALALLLDGWMRPAAPLPAQALTHVEEAKAADPAQLRRVAGGPLPMPEGARAAHASSLLVMPPGDPAALTVFWFSGERESGPQVQIVASQWLRAQAAWSAPVVVVNRGAMGELLGLGLRRLGNPVVWRDARGQVHLFVVATGWGGWAASRVLHLRQRAGVSALGPDAMEPVGWLPLSWLWNTSYLVRNAPMGLQDGGAVLPVHFELGSKVPAVVRLGPEGRFAGMTRMSNNDYWLQPALLAPEPSRWLALMRDQRHGGRIGAVQTTDGGAHWQALPDLDQPNPDASVATLQLAPERMLLAHNPLEGGRYRLDLSHSADGLHWTRVLTLEQGANAAEFSYPAMAWADGALWVTYTVERETLSWQKLMPTAAPAPAQSGASASPARGAAP